MPSGPSRRKRLASLVVAAALLPAAMPPAPAGAIESGIIETVAGGKTATEKLAAPRTAAVDNFGNIFFTDTDNHLIRRVDPSGNVTTIAGNGSPGYSGDGGPATQAEIWRPHGIAVDNRGHVLIADSPNHRIRRIDLATGIIATVAGTGIGG
ncbi:MAG TPA: hypothetical protein VI854_08300, partial [Acidimicrobiia bacterium]|nr:hypothetical protein [Acidimicrobiia bacterium]